MKKWKGYLTGLAKRDKYFIAKFDEKGLKTKSQFHKCLLFFFVDRLLLV